MKLNVSVDNLMIYDSEFGFMAKRFVNEIGSNSAVHCVKTVNDLIEGLNRYNGVRFLEICLHGKPGRIFLSNNTEIAFGIFLEKQAKNQLFLAKGARILFDSCSVGAGDIGDKFMDSVAQNLLKGKGGFIGASTVPNASFPYFPWVTGAHIASTCGRLKVKKYDESGNLTNSIEVAPNGIAANIAEL